MKHPSIMPRFLLASLCLHVALLWPMVSAFQFAGQQETILNVTLAEIARAIESPAGRAARPVASKKSVPSRTAEANSHADTADAITASTPPTPDTNDNRHPAVASASARAQVQAQLLADLQRYFEYPMLARRRGWQGTVWLSFLIESDGALQRIQVAKSSGYDNLDDSAVAAMRQVRKLGGARQLLNGHPLEMSIPVVYQLKDY